jgi:membrane-bound lytic murein transglycosylase B
VGLVTAIMLVLVAVATVADRMTNDVTPEVAAAVVEAEPEPPEIPPRFETVYRSAALACDGLSWEIVAGIARVESDHGRFGGGTPDPNGRVTPEILGIRLDGTNGTARVPDSDDGLLDGDWLFDRAVGPFQFIPTSWELYGLDADGDGVADPHDIDDAAPAAVRHLCPTGAFGSEREAVFNYNRSSVYVDAVLEAAQRYRDS